MANYMGIRTTMSMETGQLCHLFQGEKKRYLHFCADSASFRSISPLFLARLTSLFLRFYYILLIILCHILCRNLLSNPYVNSFAK